MPFIWIVVHRDCLQHQGAAWLLWSRSSWPCTGVWVIGRPSTTFANCFKCWPTCSLWGFCMKTSKVRWSDLQSRGCIIYMKNQRWDHLTNPSLGAACMKASKVRSSDLQFGDCVQRDHRWDHLTFSLVLHVQIHQRCNHLTFSLGLHVWRHQRWDQLTFSLEAVCEDVCTCVVSVKRTALPPCAVGGYYWNPFHYYYYSSWHWCSGQPAGERRHHGDSPGRLWSSPADSSWPRSPQPLPYRLTGSLEPRESHQRRSRVPLRPVGVGLRPHSHAEWQPPLDQAIPRCCHPQFYRKLLSLSLLRRSGVHTFSVSWNEVKTRRANFQGNPHYQASKMTPQKNSEKWGGELRHFHVFGWAMLFSCFSISFFSSSSFSPFNCCLSVVL